MTIRTSSSSSSSSRADEKTTNGEIPVSFVDVDLGQQRTQDVTQVILDPPKKAHSTRKLVLIAVAVVLCLGLVVTAVLVTLKLVLDADAAIVQYTVSTSINGQSASETVAVDGNIVTRSVVTSGYTAWLVEDYDKSIQVTKIQSTSGVICYVSALNRSDSYDAISAITTSPASTNSTPDEVRLYTALGDPIPDISYLGTTVSDMCSDIPTYWALPQCGTGSDSNDSVTRQRRKRQVVEGVICCAPCPCSCPTCGGLISCHAMCCFSCRVGSCCTETLSKRR